MRGHIKAGIGIREGLIFASLFLAAESLPAADAALVYNKNYQCGKEIVQGAYCRRDSDEPGMPPTRDADNYCQVYYLDRPKNNLGGTAFGVELRGDLEKRLTACGALVAAQPAPQPASAQPTTSAGTDAQAYLAQGSQYIDARDYPKAIEAYQKAAALDPQLASARDGLASSYYKQGQYAAAIAAWQQFLVLRPNNATVLGAIGMAYRDLKQYPEAIAYLRKAIGLGPDANTMKDAWYWLSATYESAGQTDAALQAANQLKALDAARGQKRIDEIQLSASRKAAYDEILRGQKFYDAKDYAKSIAAFQAAIPLAPDATTAALADRWIGSAYRELKNYDQSIAALRESLQLEPGSENSQFGLGWTYYLAKRYPEALAGLQEAVRLAPNDADNHYWIGEVQLFGLNQPQKALAAYQDSLRLRPNDARTINQTGLAYVQLKQGENAIAAFKEAVRLKPDEPIYYRNLAIQYAKTAKFDDATRVSQSLRKFNAKKADELDKELLDMQVAAAIDGPPKS